MSMILWNLPKSFNEWIVVEETDAQGLRTVLALSSLGGFLLTSFPRLKPGASRANLLNCRRVAQSSSNAGEDAAFDPVRDKPLRSGRARIARTVQPSLG